MSKKGNKAFLPSLNENTNNKDFMLGLSEDLTIEGTEGEILSVIPAEELKERAEYEENTGLRFDSNLPDTIRRDEICATFGSVTSTYVDPELLSEAGSTTAINSINVGKFLTGGVKGFKTGRKTGFMGYSGRGFMGSIGIGFAYEPTEGFGNNFMTGKKGFDPIGFDTVEDPHALSYPVLCPSFNWT